MAENRIEVVIQAVDRMSADLKRVEGQLATLEGTTGKTGAAMGKALVPARQFNTALQIMARHVADLGPTSGLFAQSLTNIATRGLGAGLIIGGISLAISLLLAKIKEIREEAEKPFGLGEGKDPHARQRALLDMTRTLDLAIRLEMARADPAKQMTMQLEAQAQKLKDQFPLNAALIDKLVALLRAEKLITLELGEQESRAKQLEAIRDKVAAGRRRTQEEEKAARDKEFDEEQERARRLGEIRQQIAKQTMQTMEEEEKLLKERLGKLGLDARNVSQGIMAAIEGGKKGLLDFAARTGRRIAESLMEGMIEALVISPLKNQLQEAMSALFKPTVGGKGGTGFNIPGLLSKGLGLLGGFFGGGGGITPFEAGAGLEFMGFARGGMVVPRYGMPELNLPQLRRFQSGGVVEGPTLGVIGEEGPEIVARMKPAGSRDAGQPKVTVVINGDITPRRPDMRPEDVIKVVANDAERGGDVGRAMQNVIRRAR